MNFRSLGVGESAIAEQGVTVGAPLALSVARQSIATFIGGTISGEINADSHSMIVLQPNASVVGNITISGDSAIVNDADPSEGSISVSGDVQGKYYRL